MGVATAARRVTQLGQDEVCDDRLEERQDLFHLLLSHEQVDACALVAGCPAQHAPHLLSRLKEAGEDPEQGAPPVYRKQIEEITKV